MTITINPFPKKPSDTGNPKLPSNLFTACGTGIGKLMRQITFTLQTSEGDDVNIDKTNIQCQHWTDQYDLEHLIWTIVFEKVDEGKDYNLTVANADDTSDKADVTLDVVAPSVISKSAAPASQTGIHNRLVKIQNPLTGATIPSAGFAPYGTTDVLLPLSAIVNVPGASSVNGTLVQGPPATGNWVFSFTQLPTGTGASLSVFNSSQGDTATNLTIQ